MKTVTGGSCAVFLALILMMDVFAGNAEIAANELPDSATPRSNQPRSKMSLEN